jgi:hypothetical protein
MPVNTANYGGAVVEHNKRASVVETSFPNRRPFAVRAEVDERASVAGEQRKIGELLRAQGD